MPLALGWGVVYVYISKIVTFINMVINGVENGSLDMILMAFEGKCGEKKDEIPPGIYKPRILQIIQCWGVDG